MAPNKNTRKASNSRKNKSAAQRQGSIKERGAVQDEIILVIALVVSILLLLSNFNLCGSVGKAISSVLFGLVGAVTYIIPFIIFFTIAFYISNIGNRRAGRKIISAMVFFIALAALIQMIANPSTDMKVLDYFKESYIKHNGGGILGGTLALILCKLFAEVATYIILIAIMAICVIIITGKAIFTYLAKKSKSSLQERMEYQRLRREEQGEDIAREISNEKGRRSARTFVINETTPSTLKASAALPEQKEEANAKNRRKNREKSEEELPVLNFHHLFDEEKQAEPVPAYEEELRLKFGDKEESEEPVYQDTDVVHHETHVDNSKNLAETKPLKPQQKAAGEGSMEVDNLNISQTAQQKEYIYPPVELLTAPKPKAGKGGAPDKELKDTAFKLQSTLDSFGVHVTVTNVSVGPAVTRYELQPEQGVKVSRITSLADDIKLNLAASDVRIEAPIPGKAAVGIEVPNKENSMVTFREMIESREFTGHASNLAFAVGKDIGGQTIITDIAKMPHLLIAGATGSGKSVCINTLIMSILYKSKPSDVRMIMVDPKVVELNVYNGIPHLLIPVVTDPKKASAALNWAVIEMTERYKKFADVGARDLKGYNEKAATVEHLKDENYQKLPQIIIIIDELADLMMVAPGEVEDAICRLAQLARAAGIHLIIATQRPSVNVITGLIKANIPSRIAFAVSSAIDSRTIIDGSGAEKLLGKGDMLFFPSGYPKPVRIQGAFISDKEVSSVVEFLKKNNNEAVYSDDIHEKINNAKAGDLSLQGGGENERDEYFPEAGKFIIDKDKASIGMLQRVYKIGFNRAARIMDQLAEAGVVGPEEGTKPRKILMSLEEFEQYLEEY
jgi:S-DNA-T family DNA segregation ATPase FtsK/SpoIIIE